MNTNAGSPQRLSMWRAHRTAAVAKPMLMGYIAAAAAFAFLGAGASPAIDAIPGQGDLVIDRVGDAARSSIRFGRTPEIGPHPGDRSGDCIRNDARCIAERDPSQEPPNQALPNHETRNASAGLSR